MKITEQTLKESNAYSLFVYGLDHKLQEIIIIED